MTTPTASTETERLLELWRELEAERNRRFNEKLATGEAVHARYIWDDLSGETEVEAQAKGHAELPEKDKGKAVGWLRRTIIRPLVDAISSQDAPAASIDVPASVPREGEEPNAPKPAAAAASPPRVWEEKQGIVRIQTGSPDHASPQGYCEIARWTLNARGELVLRNEDGKLLREHRLDGDQDPADMALKLLRAWASERKSDYSGRRLPHPDDSWMA
jgi:hypothetical protein